MPERKRFRLLTPEGLVTYDTFVLADDQPRTIKADCLLVVHEASGRLSTVHRTRLIPVADSGIQTLGRQRKSPCLKCGKVEGVVGDQVVCPYHKGLGCGLLEAKGD